MVTSGTGGRRRGRWQEELGSRGARFRVARGEDRRESPDRPRRRRVRGLAIIRANLRTGALVSPGRAFRNGKCRAGDAMSPLLEDGHVRPLYRALAWVL